MVEATSRETDEGFDELVRLLKVGEFVLQHYICSLRPPLQQLTFGSCITVGAIWLSRAPTLVGNWQA